MADWSWKQAVGERIVQLVGERQSTILKLEDLYGFTDEISELFPQNRNIHAKIRQILQRLRDDGFLLFLGEGLYRLNLDYAELEIEPARKGKVGIEWPETRKVLKTVRLRDTFLASEIKRRYGNICQVCRIPLPLLKGRYYAEGHHLKPLGSPHYGPDTPGNIIVLCPNHHTMFDRGAATIVPDTLEVRHHLEGVFERKQKLHVACWHFLSHVYLQYHHARIFGRTETER